MNGLRVEIPDGTCRGCLVEVLEDIGVVSFSEGVNGLAGRQGVSTRVSRNPNG